MAYSHERLALYKNLLSLVPAQLDELVFALDPPDGIVPTSTSANPSDVVKGLLQWVESPTGCGLEHLREIFALVVGSDYPVELRSYEKDSSPQQQSEPQTSSRQEYKLKTAEVPKWIRYYLQKKLTVVVARSRKLEKLINCLLDENRNTANNIVALWGPAGFGKTSLALAACCNLKILEHFTGGLFWVDLEGNESNTAALKELYRQITNAEPASDNDKFLAAELQDQWPREPCLTVLDSARNQEQILNFIGSSNEFCTWLVTTRKRNIYPQRTFKRILIDYLRPDEAATMLYSKLSFTQEEVDFFKVKIVSDQLHEWPFLINLVGNYILEMPGYRLEDALDVTFQRLKEKGWVMFYDEIREKIESDLNSLDNEEDKGRFMDLIAFREGESISLETLEKLWGLDPLDTEGFCEKLYSLALLKSFHPRQKKIQLTSVMHQYLKLSKENMRKSSAS